jgi:hypothetical protein
LTPSDVSPLALEEYRALRATIRERGTLRTIVIGLTFLSWAGLLTVAHAIVYVPFLGLVSLVQLAVGFEIVFGLHTAVERVGRYLQARYEPGDRSLPAWEHTAMAVGARPALRTGVDPLASGFFMLATVLNVIPTALISADGPRFAEIVPAELLLSALVHALFIARIVRGRRFAATQRTRDLDFFARQS